MDMYDAVYKVKTNDDMKALAEARAVADVLRMEMQKLIDNVISDTQRAEIISIEAEFEPLIESAQNAVTQAEKKVKADILDLGESYKYAGLHAIYRKPSAKWDTKAIDGYAINHPELFAFRSEGKPSVSIRVAK